MKHPRPRKKPTTTAKELIQERRNTHGDWKQQANCSGTLKQVVRNNIMARAAKESGDVNIIHPQLEAIDMILTKVSRIVCGDATEPDHWDDIAGYAMLGKGESQND